MTIESHYVLGVIAAMALVTAALRSLPFLAARWLQQHAWVQQLGRFLPLAIMTLLLVHSVMGAVHDDPLSPLPEASAISAVLLLQWRWKNAMLSILLGTGMYVLMRNQLLL